MAQNGPKKIINHHKIRNRGQKCRFLREGVILGPSPENPEHLIFSHLHPFWGQNGSKWRDEDGFSPYLSIKLPIGVKTREFFDNELFLGRIAKIGEISGRPIWSHCSHFWGRKWPKWIDTSMLCLKEGEHVPLMYQNRISRSLTHSHGHVPKPPKNGFHENLERPIFSHFHPFWGQTGSKWRDRMFFRSN